MLGLIMFSKKNWVNKVFKYVKCTYIYTFIYTLYTQGPSKDL